MRLISILAAVATTLALVGCGSSDDSTHDPFAALSVVLDKSAFVPAFQRCVVKAAEKSLTKAQIDDLSKMPLEQQQLELGEEIIEPLVLKCREELGGHFVDPRATPEELALLRKSLAQSAGSSIRDEGASQAIARCFEQLIKDLPDPKLIELSNTASVRAQEMLLRPQARRCIDA